MEINPKLKEAALAVVRGGGVEDDPIELDDYRGMMVAKADHPDVHAIHFIKLGDEVYVIGPLNK